MRLFFLLMFFPAFCLSQEVMKAEQFFEQGLSTFEQAETPIRERVYFPWINEYEIRTETRDLDPNSQEYTLRVSPSTARIRNAQKAYYEELAHAPDFDGQEIYCDLVTALHQDWLSLFILNETQNIINDMLLVVQDKQTIYERMVGTYEFDMEKLVKLETQKSDLDIALKEVELQQKFLREKYNLQNQDLDFGRFTTAEGISEYLQDHIHSADPAALVDEETEFDKQLLLREIELEASENRQLIDFVQVKYTGPHTDLLRERISLGLGFQLSADGNQKLKMQELQIEQEELARKAEREIEEERRELTAIERQLQTDLQTFFYVEQTMIAEREQLQRLSSSIAQKEGTSPLFLLEIEERHLAMKLKSLENLEKLYLNYLSYLEKSQAICQPVFRNFLQQ